MNENLLYILKNKKKSQGQYYYYNKYNREVKNRNFEENKNSPFEINEINGGINIKSHEQIYSLNQNKYGFFPNEVDLNFEKNNTLLNDKNIQAYDENIYKEILFQNSKKSEKRTIKIIKCEKINSSNRNNIFTNNKEKVNDNIIDKNRNKLNSDNKLILKKFKSQDFIDGQLFKNNSNSFAKKSQGIDNNFRKTLPRTNNNVLINKIIRRELSENNQKFNYISNNTQKDIFNTTDKKDIDKEKNLIKRNKLSETRNKEKTIKKIIKNEKYTSSKTTKENTMKNTLENTMKSEYKINKSNRVKSDDDYNHSSILSNQPSSKGFLGSLDNLNIYKKENKRSNIFNEKNIKEINKNLFNSKINPKKNEIIFTKKKITLSNNKEKRKKSKKIYQKSIIKNNNFNLNKYKTLDDKTNTLKDESKNRINDIKIINNNFRYTEKEILFNKINNNKNGNKNIKKNKSKNKVINHMNLNKNRNKKNFINKSDKNRDVVSISQKMNKYSSIKNITIEDINSKSFKNLSKSNDFSSYSNIKNNSSRENINKINYMSYNVDSNILFTNNKEKNNINNTNKINNKNNKKRNIENEKIKLKKNIHLDKKDEDKNSKKSNKMNKDNKNRTIINYIYNNNSINENNNFSNKNNTDFKNSNNILLKSCINQEGRQLDEKVKNMNELFCSNSKDSEFINDNISSTKEIIKEINEQCLSNIQVNSYESQFISNLNPNSNTFSCSNKSEIKLNNKINFDMPINIDLEKIEIDESKEGPKNKSNKLKKEKKIKNDVIKKDIQQNNSRLEKLDNFINQLNDEDESNDDEEEEEEEEEEKGEEKEEGEEPKEKIFIQNNKIVHNSSDLPTYGLSIEELKVSKDNINNTNGENKNDANINKNCGIDINKNGKENKANNINNENLKLYNFDLESKENGNDNKENNFSNNGFYDDISINRNNNKVNEVEKNDANYNEKRFNIGDMNIDSPHSDQEFLGNLELIQKNNKKNCLNEKELNKNNNIINNNNMKEIESEYEFNLSNEKFYMPLNKYENAFNFDKINLFKS